MRRYLDKVIRRFSLTLLDQTDRRYLHPKRILLEEAQCESAEYACQNMANAMIFERRQEIFDLALSRMPELGMIIEAGVANGDSISYIAKQTDRKVHGFDSFEGLPEDWPGRHEARGHYSTGGRLPHVPSNVELHSGMFEESFSPFLKRERDPVALLHVDCDLYSSTRVVLQSLAPRFQNGSIIIFDEYFNFIGWQEHEFKAFREFIADTGYGYQYLAWSYQQAIIVIERKKL